MFLSKGFTPILLLLGLVGSGLNDEYSQNQFLSWLFNTTIDGIAEVAIGFSRIKVTPSEVHLLHFAKNFDKHGIHEISEEFRLDFSKKTVIVVHGWTNNGTMDWIKRIARNYNEIGGYNVLSVDWSRDANKPYLYSSAAVQYVGVYVASFILQLTKNDVEKIKTFHLVGHSLGAHVVGFVGQQIFQKVKVKVGRITGMDAAGPLFEFPLPRPNDLKLSKDDGEFVDLWHTDAGFLGIRWAYGDADFYINGGGPIQPGCKDTIFEDGIFPEFWQPFSCSHNYVHELYAKTILHPREFVGKCMGLCGKGDRVYVAAELPLNAVGEFNLKTSLEFKNY